MACKLTIASINTKLPKAAPRTTLLRRLASSSNSAGSDGKHNKHSPAAPTAKPLTAKVSHTSAKDSAVEMSPSGIAPKNVRACTVASVEVCQSRRQKADTGPLPGDDRDHA